MLSFSIRTNTIEVIAVWFLRGASIFLHDPLTLWGGVTLGGAHNLSIEGTLAEGTLALVTGGG